MAKSLDLPGYNPSNLLDALRDRLSLKNDAALGRVLEVSPPVISKIRHKKLPVGPLMLIRMHEVSEVNIRELRALMGDQRAFTGYYQSLSQTRRQQQQTGPTGRLPD